MIHLANSQKLLDEVFKIRKKVFVEEQHVPEAHEYDEYEDIATHFVLQYKGDFVGTVRYRYLDDGVIKVERMAVLPEYRGLRLGHDLMKHVEAHAQVNGAQGTTLNAQSHALDFYKKLGYEQVGDEFMEENIPHIKMSKKF